MSNLNISDIHFAGAYTNAVTVAKDSDHRTADSHLETGDGLNFTGFLTTLARRVATAITGIRRTTSPLTSRPV